MFRAYYGDLEERKMFVVVSNNRRNAQLRSVLAARLTSSAKPSIASIVEMPHQESVHGRVVCDDIVEFYDDEEGLEVITGLTPSTMLKVTVGLAAALDIPTTAST